MKQKGINLSGATKRKCLQEGCDSRMRAGNLCNKHYLKLHFAQHPQKDRKWRRSLGMEVGAITGMTRDDSIKVINIILSTLISAIKRGEEVRIPGFGIFGRSVIDSKPYFLPAKELILMVNNPTLGATECT